VLGRAVLGQAGGRAAGGVRVWGRRVRGVVRRREARDFFREEESSFCEQKEAKKLHWTDDGKASFSWMRVGGDPEERGLSGRKMKKSFLVLFFKKERACF
jgi:hypothetical protein